jgi:subtilisin family serine protease
MSVRVAVVDSGVNPEHPHIDNIAGGISLMAGLGSKDYLDYLGHGTAVAAAIHEKAPRASLYIVKVFERVLVTRTERIVQALHWCLEQRMNVVNLSIGSTTVGHRAVFERIVEDGRRQQMLIVAPAQHRGGDAFPGCVPGVISVEEDAGCSREEYRFSLADGGPRFYCSGHPRPIPGVPQARNLSGISFAVANMTGFVARALEDTPFAVIEEHLMLPRCSVSAPSQVE